jgi:hypothetical protein
MDWIVRLLRGLQFTLYGIFLAALLSTSSLRYSTEAADTARRFTRPLEFDYFDWTVDAIGVKLVQASLDSPFQFSEADRHRIVLDDLRLVDEIQAAEYQLNLIFADPSVRDPQAESAALRARLADLRAEQSRLAPFAEAVLQEQISSVLIELGLDALGRPLPPVLFHITPLPNNLIVSPRDRIQQDASISLVADISVDQQVRLEDQVDAALGVSSLVVPVGGIGSYPTMVMRTTALDWLADTIAHEWIHNWLGLRPLGANYSTTPELRTMNETTASIAGAEIARLVLQRYYPERLAAEPVEPIGLDVRTLQETPQTGFDFRAEMHITRVAVDRLLAAGDVAQAEAYMEARRRVFWENGYAIRKLNQAYFAFYGAYADTPGGAAGEDPVGPAVRQLRDQSDSLTDFLYTIASMDSYSQLQAALSP